MASPGPVDLQLVDIIPTLLDVAKPLIGLIVGLIFVVKPEMIPILIKNLFSLPAKIKREYIVTQREQ